MREKVKIYSGSSTDDSGRNILVIIMVSFAVVVIVVLLISCFLFWKLPESESMESIQLSEEEETLTPEQEAMLRQERMRTIDESHCSRGE